MTAALRRWPRVPLGTLAGAGLFLVATLAVRGWGLPGTGLVFYDEGWDVLGGRKLLSMLTQGDWGAAGHALAVGPRKPAHDLLLGSLLALGVPPSLLTWVSGVAGVVMVLAITAIAWRRWGPPAGVVAGVFVGTVPLGIIYGHHALAEGLALGALAVALYVWDRAWSAPASGSLHFATLGLIAATLLLNYRFLPTLAPLVELLLWRRRRRRRPRPIGRRRLIASCLAPAALILTAYLVIALDQALGRSDLDAFGQSLWIRAGTGGVMPFGFPDFYPRLLWDFGGAAAAGALLLGVVGLIRNRRAINDLEVVVGASLVGTLLFFGTVHDKAPRALAVCLPFAALIAACGVTLGHRRRAQWVTAAAICTVCLVGGWAGSGEARDASGTEAAGRWLAAQPGGILADRVHVFGLYVCPSVAAAGTASSSVCPVTAAGSRWLDGYPDVFATVGQLRAGGIRWVVVDGQSWSLLRPDTAEKELVRCGTPAVEFSDPAGSSRHFFLESADYQGLGYDQALQLRAATLKALGNQLRIYDLDSPQTSACE